MCIHTEATGKSVCGVFPKLHVLALKEVVMELQEGSSEEDTHDSSRGEDQH